MYGRYGSGWRALGNRVGSDMQRNRLCFTGCRPNIEFKREFLVVALEVL
ncbi:hypothetical protein I3843_06G017800 [Carya illinoinensis]|nr:hypothetical protein I3843_06G017800 [Carya illinoinensis]